MEFKMEKDEGCSYYVYRVIGRISISRNLIIEHLKEKYLPANEINIQKVLNEYRNMIYNVKVESAIDNIFDELDKTRCGFIDARSSQQCEETENLQEENTYIDYNYICPKHKKYLKRLSKKIDIYGNKIIK